MIMCKRSILLSLLSGCLSAGNDAECFAQRPDEAKKPVVFTVQDDHHNMMQQLGITKLRPGPSGNEQAPNHANYDETLANPYGDAHWLDHQGSFMAAIAAQPVYRLLGAQDLGRSDDYKSENMAGGQRRSARRRSGLAPT